jgi:DNA (cytosine-5)-methyltransferase 1
MRAIDFFCGAGGLTRGLMDAGLNVVAGIDNDEACRETYEFNTGVKFIARDVRTVSLEDLRRITKMTDFTNTLFAGCAPCQPFSKQNKGVKRQSDAVLLSDFGRLIRLARPGCVMMENVSGISKVKGFSAFKRFLKTLDDSGYSYKWGVVDAKSFGVPQSRLRLVLVGTRLGIAQMPSPKYGPGLRPYRTVRQAIAHFPPVDAGKAHKRIVNHSAASITPLNLERLEHTPLDGGSRLSWPEHLWLACHKTGYDGHSDVYGRLAWDAPAPTLTGRCTSISNGRYGHPEQLRAITLREAAALQSFPDGYVFFGSQKHIAQQIGNAVPVRMAEALGRHILSMHCG